jgi:hypothetical protein
MSTSKTTPRKVKLEHLCLLQEVQVDRGIAGCRSYFLVTTYIPNAGNKLQNLDERIREWDTDYLAYLKKPSLLFGVGISKANSSFSSCLVMFG